MAVVMEALDCGFLNRAAHPFDLAIGPGMAGPGPRGFNTAGFADHVESHRPRMADVPVAGLLSELDDVVGQYGVDVVGNTASSMC